MSTTAKNWITTLLAAFVSGAVLYATSNPPPSADTWIQWRPFVIGFVLAGLTGAYHSYQQASGSKGKVAAIVGSALIFGILATFAFAPRYRTVASVKQEGGHLAFVEAPMLAGEGCQNGQLSPQFVEVSTASLNLLACGLNTYAQNTTTSPINWGTVALDLATNCGMDVVDIVNLFGANSPVAQAATATPEKTAAIHAAAMAFKAKNLNGPVTPAPAK